ncbi:hypothetical protein Rrhod_4334 [Rhodococcus rhodnii LMG 5362]|uniref:Uncharacterized protein n=1 Tax=Rhodococcus rhodnii LMG 5362 TaxID=1273125 RepID=R7WH10_9NOCA|nr:hypothetical protein Rrhod_4334 [Rhodococcus rhodnii LMG 5362]
MRETGRAVDDVAAVVDRYRRPDGAIGRHMIVQLRDVTTTNEES